ncbi:hypothetical protein PMM47T1_13885 [Pseudomonas sp. M47T1]|uniref:hypothetical protein n=1 Tax=Pseudomonas sp. M47T1 TaxID=1179778 RepID=UPI00026085EC|nr:hypothetical protein [Pseudomonas sp. M47T1]EIK96055.1 hypothetical protein PMM47T1_13885 [Pseudomonas sp. M47T1]
MNYFHYEHQWPLVGYNEMLAADFADAATQKIIVLPEGALVTRAFVLVTTAYNSGTTATLSVGDGADADRYGSAIDLATVGIKELTPSGFITTAAGAVTATFAQTGTAATAGAARVYVEYVVERKSDEVSE